MQNMSTHPVRPSVRRRGLLSPIRLLRELSEMDRKHYPGRGGVIFVVNTPPLFGLVWQGIRGFLATQVINVITPKRRRPPSFPLCPMQLSLLGLSYSSGLDRMNVFRLSNIWPSYWSISPSFC